MSPQNEVLARLEAILSRDGSEVPKSKKACLSFLKQAS